MNAAEEIEETLLASCRRELIEEGKLVLTDTGYQLTELGQKAVQKELRRYEFRPAMLVMIETYVLNLHECPQW
ncbi:ABC transporter ATP-binding protein [Cohnella cellulosilytica]|uniref:ABC transporter ATP-binding protein n=1 Tax=Cohnella cellulosilytica TaxID=986710 RepID=A0ABW2FH09_9BACL